MATVGKRRHILKLPSSDRLEELVPGNEASVRKFCDWLQQVDYQIKNLGGCIGSHYDEMKCRGRGESAFKFAISAADNLMFELAGAPWDVISEDVKARFLPAWNALFETCELICRAQTQPDVDDAVNRFGPAAKWFLREAKSLVKLFGATIYARLQKANPQSAKNRKADEANTEANTKINFPLPGSDASAICMHLKRELAGRSPKHGEIRELVKEYKDSHSECLSKTSSLETEARRYRHIWKANT